jgi:hypothetical protein
MREILTKFVFVQKREWKVMWGILIKYIFGSQREMKYFKTNLLFYP